MINTWSAFYYGQYIDATNRYFDFDEGGSELTAILRIGDYTLTTFASEVSRALNEAGGQTYTVSVDRTSRKLTISATSNFSLLVSSGSHSGASAFSLIGFTLLDKTGTNSYEGDSGSGSSFIPQVKLQKYTPFSYNKKVLDSTTTVSSDGTTVQTVSNGDAYFMKCQMQYINNYDQESSVMLKNTGAIAEAIAFLEYATKKRKMEFTYNYLAPNTYETCLLESTPEDQSGTAFELKEMIGQIKKQEM